MKRSIVLITLASLPLLQGCMPLVVTGMGAAAMMANDRRTSGTYIEDESIEWKAVSRLRDINGRGAHVNPTSFNRLVLLTGEAPTEELKREAEEIVRKIESVKQVTNEIRIAAPSNLAARGNDALITSNVKARMVNNGRVSPTHVKVLTEANVVYMMGLLTPEEADAAVEVARSGQGVSRVVKVFEYVK
jgi:osmotically-inducible protein OsmY